MGLGHLVDGSVPVLVLFGQAGEQRGNDRVGQADVTELHRPIMRPASGPAIGKNGRFREFVAWNSLVRARVSGSTT
jgi:hypothetical protein